MYVLKDIHILQHIFILQPWNLRDVRGVVSSSWGECP